MDQLLDMPKYLNSTGSVWIANANYFNREYCDFSEQLMELMHARARRRFSRGLKRKPMALVKKLREAKKEAPPNEKPEVVKTHLRNMIIVPEMVGSIVGVYNGKTFNLVRMSSKHTVESITNRVLANFSFDFRLKSSQK